MPETSLLDEVGGRAPGKGKKSLLDEIGSSGTNAGPSLLDQMGAAIGGAYEKSPQLQAAVGLGRGVVDLMSRGMYASAGAAEEVVTPSVLPLEGRVVSRVGRELFSGLPFTDIQGDKRDYIEVMERAGVPELGHLHDLVSPALPGIGAIFGPGKVDPTGRGMIGFAADVALDPTTYVTAGGSTTGRFATAKGVLNLNKKGLAVKDSIVSEFGLTYKLLNESDDAVLRETGRRQVRELLEQKVTEAVRQDPKLLEKTGIKFAGMEVVSPRLLRNMTEPVKKMLVSAPFGQKAAVTAEAFGDGFRRTFDAFADIAKLDDTAKEGLKNKVRDYQSALAANLHREAQSWDAIRVDEARLARKYGRGDQGRQALGKKFADWREGTGTPSLSTEEEEFFKRVAANYDHRSDVNVKNGAISGEQYDKYKGRYLHHEYTNKEVLTESMARQAVADGLMPAARVNKERQFETLAEAVSVSKALEREGQLARQRGLVRPMYGELKPEYSISKNLWSHMEQSNRSIFQKKMFDDITQTYGAKIDEFYDPSRVYALNEAIPVPDADRKIIDEFVQDHTSLKAVATGHEGWDKMVTDAKAVLPSLSDDGQREVARQLTSMAKDESHILRVREAFGEELMPKIKAMKPGDIDPFFLKHGLPEGKSRLVTRSGGVWGEKQHLMPQAIADLLDDADHDLLKSKALTKNVEGIVTAWDKIGNAFKGITYPFYPAGATRDLYNNLQNGFLALGVGSISRPDLAAKIRLGGDGIVEIRNLRMTAKQWRTLSEDLRVVDPSASSFVQTTGKTGAEKATLYAKARAIRGQVDNGTRTQLWTAGMRMGMTPEDSARMVKEFLYDYSELSPFDRDIMRRVMPFYVFPRKTIGLYPQVAVKTPGRLANLHKVFQGRDSENNEMTSWEGEGYKLRLDKNGRDLTVLNGVDLPVRSFDMLWSGGWQKSLERTMGSAHPIPKVWYMLSTGRDPFRGREMTRTSAPFAGKMLEGAPKWVQDWVGWKPGTDAAGRPIYTVNEEKFRVLLEASMTSRIFSMTDSYFRDTLKEEGAPNWWLRFLTGTQLKTLNLDTEKQKKLDALTKIAEDEAVKQGTMREFRKVYTPKGQK